MSYDTIILIIAGGYLLAILFFGLLIVCGK